MMLYKIKAIDQLFFRSPVPFEAGGGSQLLASYFPPLPSTYAGAFRTFLPKLEPKYQAKQLQIGYNGLLYQGEFCFPKPLDLFAVSETSSKEEEKPFDAIDKHYALEKLVIKEAPLSNFPLGHYLVQPEKERNEENGQEEGKSKFPDDLYLSEKKLETYLNGDSDGLTGFSLSDNLIKESKLGIEIGKDGMTEESMLYQIEMIRPKDKNEDSNDWELAVEVAGVEPDEKPTYVKLGGEGKVVQIEEMKKELDLDLEIDESKSTKFFKLYFATPAIFEGGWLPKWIDKDTLSGSFSFRIQKGQKIKVKLVAATLDRPISIGGFGHYVESEKDASGMTITSYKRSRPREMRYAIPAGSVYYFEIVEGCLKKAKKLFHQKCISDYRENMGFDHKYFSRTRLVYCDRGFGYALMGLVSKEEEAKLQCMKKEN